MKVIKPLTLGLMHKPFSLKGENFLCVLAMGFFSLTKAKSRFLIESEALPKVLPQLPAGQPLDMVMPKGQAEFLLCGNAYASAGKAVTQRDVSVQVDDVAKAIRVFGDREWYYGSLSAFKVTQPKSFVKMPLSYDKAFGGLDYPFNNVGSGYNANGFAFLYGQRNALMPNLEYPQQSILGHKKHYAPASFGPMDIMWQQRSRWVGSYDQRWMENRFPGLPDDADMRLHNAAAEDQRKKTKKAEYKSWQGGEPYRLCGVHPEHEEICGNLPEFRVRALLQMADDQSVDQTTNKQEKQSKTHQSVNLSADTLWFFPDSDMGLMLYRGVVPIQSSDALDVEAILLAYENLNEPERPDEHYIQQIAARTNRKTAAAQVMNEAALIPTQPEHIHIARKEKQQKKKAQQQASNDKLIAELEKDLEVPDASNISGQDKANTPEIETPEGIEFTLPDELSHSLSLEEIADGGVDLMSAFEEIDKQKQSLEKRRDEEIDKAKQQLNSLLDDLSIADSGSMKTDSKTDSEMDSGETWEQVLERVNFLPIDLHPEQGRHSNDVEQLIELLESDDFKPNDLESTEKSNHQENLNSFEPLKRASTRAKTSLDIERKKLGKPLAVKLGHWLAHELLVQQCKETLAGRDFTDMVAPGIDLSGLDLREVNFCGADLSGANFQGSNLFGANFLGACLESANFSEANLTEANLSQVAAEKACFYKADMTEAKCINGLFDDARFEDANLTKAQFTTARLNRCQLSRATLTQTNMGEITAHYSQWFEAKMRQTVLAKAQLHHADFSGAIMEKVIFADVEATHSIWNRINALRCFFGGKSNFDHSQWALAECKTCGFRNVKMNEAQCQEATFYQSDFGNSSLRFTDFSAAILCKTLFSGADFTHSSLNNADLYQTVCRASDFTDADLSEASLVHADMSNAILVNTNLKETLENLGSAA